MGTKLTEETEQRSRWGTGGKTAPETRVWEQTLEAEQLCSLDSQHCLQFAHILKLCTLAASSQTKETATNRRPQEFVTETRLFDLVLMEMAQCARARLRSLSRQSLATAPRNKPYNNLINTKPIWLSSSRLLQYLPWKWTDQVYINKYQSPWHP